MSNNLEPQSKSRQLQGVPALILKIFMCLIPTCGVIYVVDIPSYLGFQIYREQYLGLILALILISAFLNTKATKRSPLDRVPWYDILLALISLVVAGNIVLFYPQLAVMIGFISMKETILGTITILLVLEASRRLLGLPLMAIGVLFILYAKFAYLLPNVLSTREILWQRLLIYLYLDTGSLLGIPLNVAATIVFAFILFGQSLFAVGGGKFFTDISLSLVGRYRGGPAKVAVIGSALFGTLSGSASANVATTGIITIPLMKAMGYKAEFAGAVEAAASTGGLLLPPVMAATAFIMAEFLGIPYAQIAIAAVIPAILYYLGIFMQIHLRALKDDLKGLSSQEILPLGKVLKQGWIYFFPIMGLLYFLFWLNLRPETSALYAFGITLLIALFQREGRLNLREYISILQNTGKGVIDVAVICGLAGFVIGALSLTGLGLTLSNVLVKISGENVLLLLILASMTSIILGMGMPITAVYIMLVVLIAPALIEMGVQPLSAHLFIMYFGAMSFLTPPVAIAAYVAAGIANSNPVRTGFQAVLLGICAFIVPFLFVYYPTLLLQGNIYEIVWDVLTAFIGISLIAIGIEGFLFRKLIWVKRGLFLSGGLGFLIPGWESDVLGWGISIPLILWEWKACRLHKKSDG